MSRLGLSPRRLRFEPLEDRRLLSVSKVFAQAAWIVGNETTVLTTDTEGNETIYYRPNTELGYVDPLTGNLLTLDFYPGTSNVLVLIGGVASGNVSDLVGLKYSNNQLIATDGGNTVYHRDGSIMRSGGVWTYDAGATLGSGGIFYWSTGTAMISGETLRYPNNTVFRNSIRSILYGSGVTFFDATTGALSYPSTQALKNVSSNYFYEDGSQLQTNDSVTYPNGTSMVDANGTVHNEDGNVSFTPFSRYLAFSNSENQIYVSDTSAEITTAIQSNSAGTMGAFVVYHQIDYRGLPPAPLDIAVTAPDAQTLRFSWTNGGDSTTGYRVAVAQGPSPPNESAPFTDTTDNFFVVPGLTPGQRISIRVWAKDAAGTLSHSVFASGLAGTYLQTPQNGYLLESALATTFAQVYDSLSRTIIFTVDKNNDFTVFLYANDELGYINPENGDRLSGTSYEVPSTDSLIPNVDDYKAVGNVSTISSGAHYVSGGLIRNGDIFYYENGTVMRSASGTWSHPNGNVLKSASGYFWSTGTNMRVDGNNYYPNGATLKAGTSILYDNGNTFLNTTSVLYVTGVTLKGTTGNHFYENGTQLFSSSTFKYTGGTTMVDSSGSPFFSNGTPTTTPFRHVATMPKSDVYIFLGTDQVARYAIPVRRPNSNYVFGGTFDYAAFNGDFSRNQSVDAADYVLWRKTKNSTFNLTADANANGVVDSSDYGVWRAHFGQTLPAASASTAGEAAFDTPALKRQAQHDLSKPVNLGETSHSPALAHVAVMLSSPITIPSVETNDRTRHATPAYPISARHLRDQALVAWLNASHDSSSDESPSADTISYRGDDSPLDQAFDSLETPAKILEAVF